MSPSSTSRRVHEPYVAAALAIGLSAGFGLAAVLVAALTFNWLPGAWWIASIQAHGHAQLFGWAGLFVLGVGLFFLPRLRGTVLARAELAPWALGCLVVGISLRAVCQPLLAVVKAEMPQELLWAALGRAGLGVSGVLELASVAMVVVMLMTSYRRGRPLMPDSPIVKVRPFLAVSLISLGVAAFLNAVVGLDTAWRDWFLYDGNWDNAITHLMIMGFILPMAFALSLRNLPLFMRLAFPPRRELVPVVVAYVTGLVLAGLALGLERLFGPSWGALIGGLGDVLEGAAVLAFIWAFDLLLRRKQPWTTSRIAPPPGYVETRKPTRQRYPDYGEFGRFELLVISAYSWLAFAAAVMIVNGVSSVVTSPTLSPAGPFFNPDIPRHAITVGFITLLIFGMAVRMLPGFSGKTRVASTPLVLATFWLGNIATLFRVAPLFAPDLLVSKIALGSSGAIGWLAVACLAVNLYWTWERDNGSK
jgi:uncharacterized protein involved in response to NO